MGGNLIIWAFNYIPCVTIYYKELSLNSFKLFYLERKYIINIMESLILLMMLITLFFSIIYVALSFRTNENGQCYLRGL